MLAEISSERSRQVSDEGYSHDQDDGQPANALSMAAAAYAASAGRFRKDGLWLFAREEWKPRSPREDLDRAGALIVAAIERLDRLAKR